MFPESGHGDLAGRIAGYWIDMLHSAWQEKPERVREKDLRFDPADPISRIKPRTVVIAYPDSVRRNGESTLDTLDRFLGNCFPAVRGLHLLPACRIMEERFNDGYFSQVERNRIHPRFGTNQSFAELMEKYFSMADFVLNHVDVENPVFQSYLDGNDAAGECFYVFSEPEYFRRKAAGDFDRIFRPRPFPLFTIFRRRPTEARFARASLETRIKAVDERLGLVYFPAPVIGILSIFDKIVNDQTLLEIDYALVLAFRRHLEALGIDPDSLFTLSEIQETNHPPYIFRKTILTRADILTAIGYDREEARHIVYEYEQIDPIIFGEPVRALTTFSHVQADVNTSTFAGLKMLADDFSWYLGLDLNMLRLDAANYAFKKWGTNCFGLPEVKRLMRILYLSLDAVSPRIVANLEVNDTLGTILGRMADRSAAAPPMMYDFHLASILPAVFNTGNAEILTRVPDKLAEYETPKTSIRFSVAESHDGKSVRGSLDLLTISERQALAETVKRNGGRIKYKAVPLRQCPADEFDRICAEAGLDRNLPAIRLFENPDAAGDELLRLRENIRTETEVAEAVGIKAGDLQENAAVLYFAEKVLHGREPYELCVSTRDALVRLQDRELESARYLSLYTMAFAMMGRNVKSIYFNDLIGLPNDYGRMEKTGELRDIKRTRSEYEDLVASISDKKSIFHLIAREIDRLIAIVDGDPALNPRGNESIPLSTGDPAVAMIHNHYGRHHSFTIVNTAIETKALSVSLKAGMDGTGKWMDRIGNRIFQTGDGKLEAILRPFGRLWLASMPD